MKFRLAVGIGLGHNRPSEVVVAWAAIWSITAPNGGRPLSGNFYEKVVKVKADVAAILKFSVPLALFVCAYHVGTRKGELRLLRWEQVDFGTAQIRLTKGQTKGKRREQYRSMAIWSDGCDSSLKTAPRIVPGCFYHHGHSVGAQLAGWHEACEQAGVPGLLSHDLRRSAARNRKRAGNPDKAVMEISGHKTRSIFDRYDIVSDADIESVGRRTAECLKARKEAARKLRRVK
jgi:integrase